MFDVFTTVSINFMFLWDVMLFSFFLERYERIRGRHAFKGGGERERGCRAAAAPN